MGLKSKLTHILIHKNQRIAREFQHYSNKLRQAKANKFNAKNVQSRASANSVSLSLFDQGKRVFVLGLLNLHYRIFRRKKWFFKDLRLKCAARKPYMNGSESEGYKRWDNFLLVKYKLLHYDVVSFDIFDTLILRPFQTPSDLFMVLGDKFNQINFKNIRYNAEQYVRSKMEASEGHREVTIHDIYKEVNRETGIDVEYGVQTEFQAEKDFCFANPYMLQVFKMLKSQGKKIVITSDMYIPHDMMVELLASCGYTGYDKLYVSCDYKTSKRQGVLYDELIKDNPNKKIIHVGDNFAVDIVSAQDKGIDAHYYVNCHEQGGKYRADGMSELVGSFYSGIVNTHLHNGTKTYTPYYEYGFTYGGLYITGFCNWIYKKAKEQGVEKILFLARDSDVYIKVFNKMFSDMPNEYVYWSRIANLKYTAEHNRHDFFTRMVVHKAHSVVSSKLEDVLKSAGLKEIISLLPKHNLTADDLLTAELIEPFKTFLVDNYDKIIKIYEKEAKVAENKFREIIGNHKKVAVVDVGWIGSGPMGIKWLVEEKWKLGCEVKCYMAGSMHRETTINIDKLLSGTIETYIFSRMYNRNLYDVQANTNKGTNNIYFELLTQACHPSFAGFSDNGEYKFDVPEIKNYAMTKEIQKGILDFADKYLDLSKNYTLLRNISGYDAYMPYRFAIRNVAFVANLFSNTSFSRNVGVNIKNQKQETVGDILKALNI